MSKSLVKIEPLEDPEDYEVKPTVNNLYYQSSYETNSRLSDDEKKPVVDELHKEISIHILPVIKNEDTTESSGKKIDDSLYACAKCPEKFNDIQHLTKHIPAHNDCDAKKRGQGVEWSRLSMLEKELLDLKRLKLELDKKTSIQKVAITFSTQATQEIGQTVKIETNNDQSTLKTPNNRLRPSSNALRQQRYYERHKEEINKRKRERRLQKKKSRPAPATPAERSRKYRERHRQKIKQQWKDSRLRKQNVQQGHTECSINNRDSIVKNTNSSNRLFDDSRSTDSNESLDTTNQQRIDNPNQIHTTSNYTRNSKEIKQITGATSNNQLRPNSNALRQQRFYEKHKEEINKRRRERRLQKNTPQKIKERKRDGRLRKKNVQQGHTECSINNKDSIEKNTKPPPTDQHNFNSSNGLFIDARSTDLNQRFSKSVVKLEPLEDPEDYEEKPTVKYLYYESSNETDSRVSYDEKKPVIDDQSSQSDDSESQDCVDSVDELPMDIPNHAPVFMESWPSLPEGVIKNEDTT